MGISGVFGALKYLPASLGRKALEKFDPSFKSYFAKSLSYGIDADRALEYVMQKFEGKGQQDYKQRLEEGAANKTLRPDEAVSRSQQGLTEAPARAIKSGLAAAAGLGFASGDKEQMPPQQQAPQSPHIPPQVQQLPENMSAQQEELIPSSASEYVKTPEKAFPNLFEEARKGFEHGLSPEDIYGKMRKARMFSGLIKSYEEQNGSFLDTLYQMSGRQRQGEQNSQGSLGKNEFLQGLAQLSQSLSQLKGR